MLAGLSAAEISLVKYFYDAEGSSFSRIMRARYIDARELKFFAPTAENFELLDGKPEFDVMRRGAGAEQKPPF